MMKRFLLALALSAAALFAQDAGLALSTSVSYNTMRLSMKLTPDQAAEAARLGAEATKATQAGKFGESLGLFAHGMAVMRGVEWTPEVEMAAALRAKLDHAMVDQSSTKSLTVTLAPLYPVSRAAKLSASIVLTQMGKEVAELAPKTPLASMPFVKQVKLPQDTAGDYAVEVRLVGPAGPVAANLRPALHVEDLSATAARLRSTLNGTALPSAEYVLALYDRADKGEVNARLYDFRKEFATAQALAEAAKAGKDPFAGRKGDSRRAYRSNVDQSLQPYRLFIPSAYDGVKPLPLVVALHGMGGDENSMFDQYGKEMPVDAEKAGFIVVAPKGRDPASMYRGTAEQDVVDVMTEVQRNYIVDPKRIYLMGHSMGGFGTWSIAMKYPEWFAALGPIAGGGDPSGMAKLKDVPQYITHGDDDRTVNVSYSRSMVEAGKKVGAPITYVEVPGGSHTGVAQPAFAPMFEFFSTHSRK